MKKKILLTITLFILSLTYTASAQQYSLYEAKKMKEGRTVLTIKPHLWFGLFNPHLKTVTVSESESLEFGPKKACQYAAIKALAKLQKKAKKKDYIIVKNIHSPNAKPGFYYCNIGESKAKVELRGTFANK